MSGDSVTLTGFWGSPFVFSVKWALELKGVKYQYNNDIYTPPFLYTSFSHIFISISLLLSFITSFTFSLLLFLFLPISLPPPHSTSFLRCQQIIIQYQYVEEDLSNKSAMLLQCNPVYKQVPVLVHDGKPLAESQVILEYIDETWKQNPLLPHDPYERAKARFWSKFTQEKCEPVLKATFLKAGEEQQKAVQEVRENLKTLEGGLEGKRYFGGEGIGFTDIAIGWLGYWVRIVEEIVGISLVDTESMAKLNAWFDDFLELPIIKECIPNRDKLLQYIKTFHNALTPPST